jgi:hypothetical protein
MISSSHESSLPVVAADDILLLLYDDITNNDHSERWRRFAQTQPTLALEVLKRAYVASHKVEKRISAAESQKNMIDLVSFVINALEVALARKHAQHTTVDGDGDEGQQRAI